MLGIVWDVTKLIDRIFERHEEETKYLRDLIRQRDKRITELEVLLSEPAPNAIEPARGETPRRVRNWRDQRRVLEHKFRPPEFQEREEKWRREAKDAVASLEVEQNA